MSQLYALASAMLYGVADFSGGLASRHFAPWRVVAWSQLIGSLLLLPAIVIVGWTGVTTSDLVFGSIAGLAGVVGVYALYRALAEGTMSIVSPMTATLTAVIPLTIGLLQGESLTTPQWVGIAAALVAIVLVVATPQSGPVSKSVIGHTLLAAFAFATFFVVLGQTSTDSGLVPLVGARLASLPIAFFAAWRLGVVAVPRGRPAVPVAVAGAFDMGANIAILLALQTGPLGLNTVIVSLYPAFTVIAAIAVIRERPRPVQVVGIVFALLAVALLAL
ncbi:MAG: EamA family transporter [Acidimicrobiia bacterium]